MEADFHELVNVEEVHDGSALVIPRARALDEAVSNQGDYTLVRLFRHRQVDHVTLECIVVDVECDGVPPKNVHGIRYRERLALCVPEDPKQLVEVLALRRDFPTLIHQNQTPIGAPASLCLYFEPAPSVLRTWTPQKFLRRLQWWLEQSAKGTLHPANQAVEQLFFVTKYELVLPRNFDELRARVGQRFVVRRGQERPDKGETYFLIPMSSNGGSKEATVAPIELTLPPILHGHIERDPATLGELADVLTARGIDILSALREAVEGRVDERGVAVSADDTFSVIVLHIPIVRAELAEPERVARRAFLVPAGPLQLGVSTGALFDLDGRYFRAAGLLSGALSTSWRSKAIFPMEVLRFSDSAVARAQSGCSDAGPLGVVVGAGALGSVMLGLWGRSGWGQWTVVDKDHIRPHNLVRHVAYAQQVGLPKSEAVAQLHDAVMQGASQFTSVCADATDFSDDRVLNALKGATLVVDASTTLEYPRLASATDALGRHVSVFITPSGNSAVLMAEDRERSLRLRTLEAQYYRAVIHAPWGERHLDRSLGTFWSGASCRDISVVLPYSHIMVQAGALVEQVQRAASRPEAAIRVWSRDPDSGVVDLHEVPVSPERCLRFGDLNVFIDLGLEQKLRSLRAERVPDETGGILLGYHDFNVNALVVVDALPAPVDSSASPAFFERGIEGLTSAVAEAGRRTAGVVGYIGEWHSHPPGYSSAPSGHDLYQLVYLALGMADEGLLAVSLIVGQSEIRILSGVVQHLPGVTAL